MFVSSSLHTQAMGNIYGYGAQQQIPNKDKSFSLGAASLHPHPFLQLVCVTLGRLIAKCCVLPAEDVTRSTVGSLFAQSLRGNYVAVSKKTKTKKTRFRQGRAIEKKQKVTWCCWYFKC